MLVVGSPMRVVCGRRPNWRRSSAGSMTGTRRRGCRFRGSQVGRSRSRWTRPLSGATGRRQNKPSDRPNHTAKRNTSFKQTIGPPNHSAKRNTSFKQTIGPPNHSAKRNTSFKQTIGPPNHSATHNTPFKQTIGPPNHSAKHNTPFKQTIGPPESYCKT